MSKFEQTNPDKQLLQNVIINYKILFYLIYLFYIIIFPPHIDKLLSMC